MITQEKLTELAELIATERDMCGDEQSAVREWCLENKERFSYALFEQAMLSANKGWSKLQIEAGVLHPLTPAEGAQAMKEVNSAHY